MLANKIVEIKREKLKEMLLSQALPLRQGGLVLMRQLVKDGVRMD